MKSATRWTGAWRDLSFEYAEKTVAFRALFDMRDVQFNLKSVRLA